MDGTEKIIGKCVWVCPNGRVAPDKAETNPILIRDELSGTTKNVHDIGTFNGDVATRKDLG